MRNHEAQARLISRLRLVLTGAVVLLILALAAGGVAAVQSERASDTAARALANETAADARRVGALATTSTSRCCWRSPANGWTTRP